MPLHQKKPSKSLTESRPEQRTLAAFDFDGTLTWTDSFVAFLRATCGDAKMAATFGRHPGLLLDYARTRDRGALKSRLLYRLLGAIPQSELEILIGAFVAKTGMSLFRPDALDAWDAHNRPDRLRVIVTASPDMLVRPFGQMIGADRVIGTRLGFSPEGRLLPELNGPNCRGAEKMCRLREAFGDKVEIDSAYGDTKGDREMLAAAHHGFYRVFKTKP